VCIHAAPRRHRSRGRYSAHAETIGVTPVTPDRRCVTSGCGIRPIPLHPQPGGQSACRATSRGAMDRLASTDYRVGSETRSGGGIHSLPYDRPSPAEPSRRERRGSRRGAYRGRSRRVAVAAGPGPTAGSAHRPFRTVARFVSATQRFPARHHSFSKTRRAPHRRRVANGAVDHGTWPGANGAVDHGACPGANGAVDHGAWPGANGAVDHGTWPARSDSGWQGVRRGMKRAPGRRDDIRRARERLQPP
jgi:hypothetical protein